MAASKIEWTDETWNPVTGCTKVSQGCKNCYAERWWPRVYPNRKFTDVQIHPDRLEQPFRWRKPRRVFVNSMSDLFHEDIPDNFIAEVISVIGRCPQHTFQVLTKRPVRAKEIINKLEHWKLPNLWLGVSAEDQETADERIPVLRDIHVAIRFASLEPLLGEIDLELGGFTYLRSLKSPSGRRIPRALDWVIAGGESGPNSRPTHPDWIRSIRNQCTESGVPFFFKQWGEWTPSPFGFPRFDDGTLMDRPGKKSAGRVLDGRTWDEYPV